MILGSIVSKERKLLDSKKIQAFINMHVPNNPHHIQVCNGMAQFYHFKESYFYFGTHHEVDETF
jgi:hypothetical protein